jgi:predicted ABC-type transport system involved in lysophospholipase L1 biosynthesis ATPase subunit
MLLELSGITKQYDASTGAPPVLRGVDLQVEAGESIAIVGPSGCGKSTLLNIIGTLDRPTAGSVRLDGTDLAGLDADELAALRNRSIGFVFQQHHLLPQCNALENVLVPTLAGGADRTERARELLARVGLAERMSARPGRLSGGECQRVAVVRALINEPRLLLADEPTGSLDGASADSLADLLGELNAEQSVTLIVVTHSPDLAQRMQRLLELRDGRLGPAGGPS